MSARVVEKHKTCAVASLTCVRYARASVRSPGVYVRTYLTTYLPTHTYGLRGGTYVCVRRAYVRTYENVLTYVRTYVRTSVRACVCAYARAFVIARATYVRTYIPDRAFVIARATYVTDDPARRARTYVRTHVCAYVRCCARFSPPIHPGHQIGSRGSA